MKILRKLLLAVSLAMIGWSVYMGVDLFLSYKEGRDTYQEAADAYVSVQPQQEASKVDKGNEGNKVETPAPKRKKKEPEEKELKAPITVDFSSLKSVNPDVAGWIYIPSIDLSYPIMRGLDNDYYLTHTWDRQEIFAASIFMDYRNHSDMEDYNTVIYGHNMKDGSMFHDIQYCMAEEYYSKSPYIWILTPDKDYKYEIFSEYDTRYDSDTYTLFDNKGDQLKEYIQKMQARSIFKSDVEVAGDEKILTLSTCNGEHDLRRIVQAKRLN